MKFNIYELLEIPILIVIAIIAIFVLGSSQ